MGDMPSEYCREILAKPLNVRVSPQKICANTTRKISRLMYGLEGSVRMEGYDRISVCYRRSDYLCCTELPSYFSSSGDILEFGEFVRSMHGQSSRWSTLTDKQDFRHVVFSVLIPLSPTGIGTRRNTILLLQEARKLIHY